MEKPDTMDKILGLLGSVGEGLVSEFVPFGDELIGVAKSIMGDDDELDPKKLTGKQLAEKFEKLSGADQVAIQESYASVLKNREDNWAKMNIAFADAEKSGKSRRGEGVMLLIKATIAWTTILVLATAYVAVVNKAAPDPWLIAAIFTFPYTVIGAYYGIKSSEIKTIMDLKSPMTGTVKPNALGGLMTGIASKIAGTGK